MSSYNQTRVFIGGIVGSFAAFIVDMLLNGFVLKNQWSVIDSFGLIKPVSLSTLLLEFLLVFVISLCGTYLYVLARPRIGASPRSALRIGLLVGIVVAVSSGGGTAIWSNAHPALGGLIAVSGLIVPVVGTFVGAWVYKE